MRLEVLRHASVIPFARICQPFRRTADQSGVAGLVIRLDRLLDIYSSPDRAPVVVVYTATMTGGRLACHDEGI